jgi:hypothetical protein
MTVTKPPVRSNRFVLAILSGLGFGSRMTLKDIKAKLLNRTVNYIGTQDGFVIIVLDDGTRLAVCRDAEINGPSALMEV